MKNKKFDTDKLTLGLKKELVKEIKPKPAAIVGVPANKL